MLSLDQIADDMIASSNTSADVSARYKKSFEKLEASLSKIVSADPSVFDRVKGHHWMGNSRGKNTLTSIKHGWATYGFFRIKKSFFAFGKIKVIPYWACSWDVDFDDYNNSFSIARDRKIPLNKDTMIEIVDYLDDLESSLVSLVSES